MKVSFMPHWVLEVEWDHLVHTEKKGFDKIFNYLFPMDGSSIGDVSTHILEGWLLSVPKDV